MLLAGQLVEQQEDGRGRVDRHRRRDLAQRDAVEQPQHVVERVDRDARPAHLAARQRIVRVEAELRRQVERDREPRLPALEQQVEALVGLLGRRETRVLAHRPRARGVAVGADAACVRVLAGALLHVLIVVRGQGLPVRPWAGLGCGYAPPGHPLRLPARARARVRRGGSDQQGHRRALLDLDDLRWSLGQAVLGRQGQAPVRELHLEDARRRPVRISRSSGTTRPVRCARAGRTRRSRPTRRARASTPGSRPASSRARPAPGRQCSPSAARRSAPPGSAS